MAVCKSMGTPRSGTDFFNNPEGEICIENRAGLMATQFIEAP